MKLHFRTYGKGSPVIILHGVFGSSDNWLTVGKELANDYLVYLVDQRNHGLSPHSDDFNYELMANDLKELMDNEKLNKAAIVGHSMGGKTAMHFATRNPERVSHLIVVDIAPRYYPPHHEEIFQGFRSLKLESLTSRKEADEVLSISIRNTGVRQFILKNLTREENGTFRWKVNLDALEKNATNIGEGITKDSIFKGRTLFIKGVQSDYILAEDHNLIGHHFPKAEIVQIEDAGHWVHAEKPKETCELIARFLSI